MNKSELIAKIAEKTEVEKGDVEKVVDGMLSTIKEVMVSGDKLQLVGFGVFEAKERAQKEGINPATGQKITIPAAKVPSFKAGKALKEEINS